MASNLLERDFDAAVPNQKWLADITYIPTREGWPYLAAILDLHSRLVVGWSIRGDYQKAFQAHKMICSMSKKGDGWDNAPAESFFHTLNRTRD